MAIQFITVKCPECSADLQIEDGREYAFCTYCGARVMITNDNEHIYRTIDEARVKQAETERMIRMREFDIEEKTGVSKRAKVIIWITSTAVLLLLGVIGFALDNEGMSLCIMLAICTGIWGGIAVSESDKKKTKRVVQENEVMITPAMMDCVDYHYNKAVQIYKNAGFVNINALPLHDLTKFNQKKEGIVESITINGNDDFWDEEVYPKNANVLITYHSK